MKPIGISGTSVLQGGEDVRTYTDFTPTTGSPPFQFSPTLDGSEYNAVVMWNLAGQRWYLWLYDLSGTLVFCLPVIGSPPNYDISITAGYFTSTLVYRVQNNQFEVSP